MSYGRQRKALRSQQSQVSECEQAMAKEDLDKSDLPKSENPSKNSELADSIRNQSTVEPDDYPSEKGRETPANPER
ncbi:hypothetical protein K3181_03050 [Qipengyuania sp. YG27]|uniref:Uncharacterized protein n=1 Tax=Qipengyuania mesophila TaxID=2867246 RepID=A0ABS7JS04_9SPHN|nr:hypothetical protein [Qipengyuania mesophila]MBX7500423.1 hypothetical protein [Qipengyuania mesophila]